MNPNKEGRACMQRLSEGVKTCQVRCCVEDLVKTQTEWMMNSRFVEGRKEKKVADEGWGR